MSCGHQAGELGDSLSAGKILRNMADSTPGIELLTIEAGDTNRFLAPVLQRMEAQGNNGSSVTRAEHPKNAAFFAQLIAVFVGEEISRECHVIK